MPKGKFVPRAAVEHPARGRLTEPNEVVDSLWPLWSRPPDAPLFEVERDPACSALLAKTAQPSWVRWSSSAAALASRYHPVDTLADSGSTGSSPPGGIAHPRLNIQGPK